MTIETKYRTTQVGPTLKETPVLYDCYFGTFSFRRFALLLLEPHKNKNQRVLLEYKKPDVSVLPEFLHAQCAYRVSPSISVGAAAAD